MLAQYLDMLAPYSQVGRSPASPALSRFESDSDCESDQPASGFKVISLHG